MDEETDGWMEGRIDVLGIEGWIDRGMIDEYR